MARRPKYATTIDVSGPFFSRDPVKTFAGNVQDMLEAMSKEGEKDAKAQVEGLAGAMSRYTGWTTDHIKGRVHNIAGKHWRKTAVVSVFPGGMDASTAIRTQAAASTIEGRWHVFRRVMSRLRRSRAVNMAELTKGM